MDLWDVREKDMKTLASSSPEVMQDTPNPAGTHGGDRNHCLKEQNSECHMQKRLC